MTKDEIRANYLSQIENKILVAEQYHNDPVFQSIIDMDKLDYSIFKGIGYSNSTFIDKVELMNKLRYEIDDDGDLTFVGAKFSCKLNDRFSIDGAFRPLREVLELVVIPGHYTELNHNEVLNRVIKLNDFVLESGSIHESVELVEMVFYRFDWDGLNKIIEADKLLRDTYMPAQVRDVDEVTAMRIYRTAVNNTSYELYNYIKQNGVVSVLHT